MPYEMCPGYSELGSQKKLIKAKVKYLDDVNVDIVQLRCLTAENGLMVVDIDFENNYRKKQQTDFLISWYENNGMAAETDPNWRMLILYPDEKRTIKLIAPNKSAKISLFKLNDSSYAKNNINFIFKFNVFFLFS